MKELTSSYDDIEKKMAIYVGLGALVLSSLYLLIKGADIFTFLIRGVLALVVFTISGWAYGHYLRKLLREHADEEQLPMNVQRESRDAKDLESRVVNASELGGEAVIPAESTSGRAVDFTMPEFSPEPSMILSAQKASAQAQAAALAPTPASVDEGDLPPPPLPPGL